MCRSAVPNTTKMTGIQETGKDDLTQNGSANHCEMKSKQTADDVLLVNRGGECEFALMPLTTVELTVTLVSPIAARLSPSSTRSNWLARFVQPV